MLLDFLAQVCAELDISPVPKMDERKTVSFTLGQEMIELRDLHPGVAFYGKICPCPEKKKEELLIKLANGNYLGQGTGPSRIGMSADEKFLTLSLGMPYEMTYKVFREHLEDFANFILYWRNEIAKFETLETLL